MSITHRHPTSTSTKFRTAATESQPLQMMDAITAYAVKMAEQTNFKVMYLSGGSMTANSLGIPDLGISAMEDVLIDARRITDAIQIPLMVDIDIDWGGALNITRTIRSFVKAGVTTVHLGDQVGQKCCGRHPGREVVSTNEMVDHVKATVSAHTDDDFIIMARTDAAASEGIDAVIERAVAYVEAGADMIFPGTTKTLDDYRHFKTAVRVPVLVNLTEFGNTPLFIADELHSASVDIALYCCDVYHAMNAVTFNFYQTVVRDGTQKAAVETMQPRVDLCRYLGYRAYEDKLDTLFTTQK